MPDLLNLTVECLINSPVKLLLVADQNWPQAVPRHIRQASVPELIQGDQGLFLVEEIQKLVHF